VTNNIVLKWNDKIDKNPILKNKEKHKICWISMRYATKYNIDRDYGIQTDIVDRETTINLQEADTTFEEYRATTQTDNHKAKMQDTDPTTK
jgi:hypothetical protein